jgi:hypothetical protein
VTGYFQKSTATRELLVAFKIPYVYEFFTQLRRQQSKVIQKAKKTLMFAAWDKAKPCTENIRGLNLVVVSDFTFPNTMFSIQIVCQ